MKVMGDAFMIFFIYEQQSVRQQLCSKGLRVYIITLTELHSEQIHALDERPFTLHKIKPRPI